MMRFFFTLVFVAFTSFTIAQEKPFETMPGWKTGLNQIVVKSIRDASSTNNCVLLKNDNELKAYLFDKDINLTKQFLGTAGGAKMLGGFINAGKIEVFLKSGQEKELAVYEIDIETGADSTSYVPLDLKGEKFLGTMTGSNSFLYITASKKDPVFNVYKFTGGQAMEKLSFDLKSNGLTKHLVNGNLWDELSTTSGLSRTTDIAIVNPDIECSADVADSKNKLYLRNDTLMLLLDKGPNLLNVFNFNLSTKSVTVRSIKRSFPAIDPSTIFHPNFNSFLLNDHLFSVQASSDSLNVLVQDFNSAKVLKYFRAQDDQPITFKNTPITQEGGGSIYSMNAERKLEKTKQLLRKMLNGSPVITAVRNRHNQDEVTIGAYKKMKQSSGFTPMMGGAIGGAVGAGMYMAMTPGFSASWSKVTRFKMLVDANSASHIEGEMQPSPAEQIEQYLENIELPAEGSTVFVTHNYHHLAYFDKEEKKLVVLRF